MKKRTSSRRNFIKQSSIAGTAVLLAPHAISSNIITNDNTMTNDLGVHIFSKHLQFLDYQNMSEAAKEMGFDGIDLTVRPKGHVLPENVSEDLPKATEAMKSFGLSPQLLATSVSDAKDPIDIKVLETASQLGYQYYRPKWIKYPKDQKIETILEKAEKQLTGLAELNKKLGISASYHNHSGHYFGSAIWDLNQILEKIPAEQVGSQYDIMHGSIEGGKNWEIGLKLIKPYINTLVVKDFVWGKKDGKWVPQYTPLGEGMVDFKKYFSLLKLYKINVPMSIHVEYDLGGAEHGGIPNISRKEVLNRIKKDLDFIRRTWKETN